MTGSGEPEASGSRFASRVLRLTVGYDGTGFLGSQRQAQGRTVQQELEAALGRLGGQPSTTEFAGRTDRGVHAVGQVVRAPDPRPGMTESELQRALNRILPDDIAVPQVARVEAGFHPRYDARWREYRYRLWIGGKQPLADRYTWVRREPLDAAAMARAATVLEGTHDLAAFTGGGEGVPWSARAAAPRGTIRTVLRCEIRPVEPWWGTIPGSGEALEVRMIADGFLPQLVRTVTGGLVAVGAGDRPVEWFGELLERADRRYGPALAPANGLILWRVGYGNDVPDLDPDGTEIAGRTTPRMEHG